MQQGESMTAPSLGSIFIDFDNIFVSLKDQYKHNSSDAMIKTIQIIGKVFSFLHSRLNINPIIRQSFGDWSMYPDALSELYIMGIRAVHTKSIPGKSSADIEMSLSLLETMLTRPDIAVMVVIAGDRDYMPVTHHIKERARQVIFFSFRECLSGDLKKLIGEDSYYYLDGITGDVIQRGGKEAQATGDIHQAMIEEVHPGGTKSSPTQPHLSAPTATLAKPATEKPTSADRSAGLTSLQIRAMKAAIRAQLTLKPQFGSVKVGRFLVVELAEALPELDHLKRKEIFNSLVWHEYIRIIAEESVYGTQFATFSLNEDDLIVKRMTEEAKAETKKLEPI